MSTKLIVLTLLASGVATVASADPWKDESGKSRERGYYSQYDSRYSGYDHDRRPRRMQREVKEEFYEGGCKIERKWGSNGDYKEERKCR